MSRRQDIIDRARDALADPRKERYPDPRLDRLIDEAQVAIVRHARSLSTTIYLPLTTGVATYRAPSDSYLISRITYNARALALKSHEEMDSLAADWEDHLGEDPKYIVYDKQDPRFFRVYPTPDASSVNTNLYGLVAVTAPPPFGVIRFTPAGESLAVSAYIDGDLLKPLQNTAGLATVLSSGKYLQVYFVRRPPKVSETQDLEVLEAFDTAIKYYVVGAALRDDRDAQNRMLGNEELARFSQELELSKQFAAMDNLAVDTQYDSQYQGVFNG